MTALLTIGTWDTPHVGHAAFLRRCERFADRVLVGVNTDRFVSTFKPAPLYPYTERYDLMERLGYTVLRNDGPGADLIREIEPDVLAVGSDWARRDYLAQVDIGLDELDAMGCALLFIPYTQGISSTSLKERLSA